MRWRNNQFPSPLWGRVGRGVARRRASGDACDWASRPPPLTPPHKGEWKGECNHTERNQIKGLDCR